MPYFGNSPSNSPLVESQVGPLLDPRFLNADQNLADLIDKTAARSNLGLAPYSNIIKPVTSLGAIDIDFPADSLELIINGNFLSSIRGANASNALLVYVGVDATFYGGASDYTYQRLYSSTATAVATDTITTNYFIAGYVMQTTSMGVNFWLQAGRGPSGGRVRLDSRTSGYISATNVSTIFEYGGYGPTLAGVVNKIRLQPNVGNIDIGSIFRVEAF